VNALNRQKNTRDRIVEAAEMLFRQHSYKGLRMTDISAHLGLSRKTLYNHFPEGKRGIWKSCVERRMNDFAARLFSIVNDTQSDYVERGGAILAIGREAVSVFYGTEGIISSGEDESLFFPELKSGYVDALTKFFGEGKRIGLLRKDLPVRSLSEVLMSLLKAWGQRGSTLMNGEVQSLPEFVERVLFTGILTDEGRRQSARLAGGRGI
jgi:AcrR family transcriptional regulator